MFAQTAVDLGTIAETRLADSLPFGNAAYIKRCVIQRYQGRLSLLEPHAPEASRLLQALATEQPSGAAAERVLTNVAVRGIIDRALACVKKGAEAPPANLLHDTLEFAIDALRSGLDDWSIPTGALPFALWSTSNALSVTGRAFELLVETTVAQSGIVLHSASEAAANKLVEGAQLLEQLLPQLSASALSHVTAVGIIEHAGGILSVTNPYVPGTIFVTEHALTDPWSVAEFLLHEALHVKYVDLDNTHSINNLAMAHGKPVTPPWRRTQHWSVQHALTAMHVYLALAVFFDAVSSKPYLVEKYGAHPTLVAEASKRRSLDRAHFLLRKIQQNREALGKAGLLFISWTSEILAGFDSETPQDGRLKEILTDEFDRQTTRVTESVSSASDHGPALADDDFNRLIETYIAKSQRSQQALAAQLFNSTPPLSCEAAPIGRWNELRTAMRGLLFPSDTSGRGVANGDELTDFVDNDSLLIQQVLLGGEGKREQGNRIV